MRTSEVACPFCSAPLDLLNEPPPLLPELPLSRSALMSFKDLLRVGVLTATTSGLACTTSGVPVYGAPSGPYEVGGSSGQAGTQGVGGASGKGGTSGASGDARAAGQGGEGGGR